MPVQHAADFFFIFLLTLVISVVNGQLPQWEQTWAMNQSTIMMVCNDTGFVRPDVTARWTIVDVSSDKRERDDK
jgi:hypothetical protein